MTLDEAIEHCSEKVTELEEKGCKECARSHAELAEWLKELKGWREFAKELLGHLSGVNETLTDRYTISGDKQNDD